MRWLRRRRPLTAPPPAAPLMVVGLVALLVAHVAILWIVALISIAWAVVAQPEVFREWSMWLGVGATAALGVAVFVGWWAVRLLVGSWVRAQPPDPLDG